MPDDTNPTTEAQVTEQPTAAPAQQPGPRLYTEEEVATIRQQERNTAAAAARREAEGRLKSKAESPKVPERTEPPQQAEDYNTIASRRAVFDRALLKSGLDENQIALIEIAYRAEKPPDPAELVDRYVKAFGKPQSNAAPPQAQMPIPSATSIPTLLTANSSAPTHPAPASTNPAAPPPSVLDWTPDMVNAYLRSKGANPNNPYSPEYRKVAREMRSRFLADAANVKVVGPK